MGALKIEDLPTYTYDDYKLWDGEWELINGVAYAMSPAPMIKHQSISSKIARQLEDYLENCKYCTALLPVDWRISDDTVVQPDNLVICHEPKHEAYIVKSPKIIFEVLSKSTASKDKGLKYNLYEQEGVRYYILVEPTQEIAKVYVLKNGKYMKALDATDETFKFELEKCSFEFDFDKLW